MARQFSITATVRTRIENLDQTVSNIKNQLKGFSAVVSVKADTSGLKNATFDLNKIKTGLDSVNTSINKTNQSFSQLGNNVSISGFSKSVDSTIKDLNKLKSAVSGAKSDYSLFGQEIGRSARRLAAFGIFATAIYSITNATREGISQALKFDREMVRLAQVGDDTAKTIGGISREISRLSTNLGVSSQELSKTSVTLRQAGLSAEEVKSSLETLAKTSLAPTFKSIDNTTEALIAMKQQFGITGKAVEEVFGSINKVSAEFAVEAEDLTTVIQKAGGAFRAASSDIVPVRDQLNQLIALFTSVRQTTRESADTISTAFRTIFARLQSNDVAKNLKEMGINLRYTSEEVKIFGSNLEGQFVGADEAIKRLSESVKGLATTDPRFSAIVEQVGGIRQISKVIPLLQQYSVAQKALGVAQGGTTSLTKDAIKAQESFIVKIDKLKESFFDLIRVFGENKTFKKFLDFGISATQIFTNLLKAMEPLVPIITILAGAKLFNAARSIVPAAISTIARPRGYATGGVVPGVGSGDIVPATVEAGSFVIKRSSAKKLGLTGRRGFAQGGNVPVMLEPQEVVIPPQQAKLIGYNQLRYINQTGKLPNSGKNRYAEGGTVGNRGIGRDELRTLAKARLSGGSYQSRNPIEPEVYFAVGQDSLSEATNYSGRTGNGRGYVIDVNAPNNVVQSHPEKFDSYKSVNEFRPEYSTSFRRVRKDPRGPISFGGMTIERPYILGKSKPTLPFLDRYNRFINRNPKGYASGGDVHTTFSDFIDRNTDSRDTISRINNHVFYHGSKNPNLSLDSLHQSQYIYPDFGPGFMLGAHKEVSEFYAKNQGIRPGDDPSNPDGYLYRVKPNVKGRILNLFKPSRRFDKVAYQILNKYKNRYGKNISYLDHEEEDDRDVNFLISKLGKHISNGSKTNPYHYVYKHDSYDTYRHLFDLAHNVGISQGINNDRFINQGTGAELVGHLTEHGYSGITHTLRYHPDASEMSKQRRVLALYNPHKEIDYIQRFATGGMVSDYSMRMLPNEIDTRKLGISRMGNNGGRTRRYSTDPARRAYYAKHRSVRFSDALNNGRVNDHISLIEERMGRYATKKHSLGSKHNRVGYAHGGIIDRKKLPSIYKKLLSKNGLHDIDFDSIVNTFTFVKGDSLPLTPEGGGKPVTEYLGAYDKYNNSVILKRGLKKRLLPTLTHELTHAIDQKQTNGRNLGGLLASQHTGTVFGGTSLASKHFFHENTELAKKYEDQGISGKDLYPEYLSYAVQSYVEKQHHINNNLPIPERLTTDHANKALDRVHKYFLPYIRKEYPLKYAAGGVVAGYDSGGRVKRSHPMLELPDFSRSGNPLSDKLYWQLHRKAETKRKIASAKAGRNISIGDFLGGKYASGGRIRPLSTRLSEFMQKQAKHEAKAPTSHSNLVNDSEAAFTIYPRPGTPKETGETILRMSKPQKALPEVSPFGGVDSRNVFGSKAARKRRKATVLLDDSSPYFGITAFRKIFGSRPRLDLDTTAIPPSSVVEPEPLPVLTQPGGTKYLRNIFGVTKKDVYGRPIVDDRVGDVFHGRSGRVYNMRKGYASGGIVGLSDGGDPLKKLRTLFPGIDLSKLADVNYVDSLDEKYNGASGVFDPENRSISILKDKASDISLLGHEFTHAIDKKAGLTSGSAAYASNIEGHPFESLARESIPGLLDKTKKVKKFYTDKGITDLRHEALAQLGHVYTKHEQYSNGLTGKHSKLFDDPEVQELIEKYRHIVIGHAQEIAPNTPQTPIKRINYKDRAKRRSKAVTARRAELGLPPIKEPKLKEHILANDPLADKGSARILDPTKFKNPDEQMMADALNAARSLVPRTQQPLDLSGETRFNVGDVSRKALEHDPDFNGVKIEDASSGKISRSELGLGPVTRTPSGTEGIYHLFGQQTSSYREPDFVQPDTNIDLSKYEIGSKEYYNAKQILEKSEAPTRTQKHVNRELDRKERIRQLALKNYGNFEKEENIPDISTPTGHNYFDNNTVSSLPSAGVASPLPGSVLPPLPIVSGKNRISETPKERASRVFSERNRGIGASGVREAITGQVSPDREFEEAIQTQETPEERLAGIRSGNGRGTQERLDRASEMKRMRRSQFNITHKGGKLRDHYVPPFPDNAFDEDYKPPLPITSASSASPEEKLIASGRNTSESIDPITSDVLSGHRGISRDEFKAIARAKAEGRHHTHKINEPLYFHADYYGDGRRSIPPSTEYANINGRGYVVGFSSENSEYKGNSVATTPSIDPNKIDTYFRSTTNPKDILSDGLRGKTRNPNHLIDRYNRFVNHLQSKSAGEASQLNDQSVTTSGKSVETPVFTKRNKPDRSEERQNQIRDFLYKRRLNDDILPSGKLSNIPDYLKEHILEKRKIADRLGITKHIQAYAITGETAARTASRLNKAGLFGDIPVSEHSSIVSAVKSQLGIPSGSDANFKEFKQNYLKSIREKLKDSNNLDPIASNPVQQELGGEATQPVTEPPKTRGKTTEELLAADARKQASSSTHTGPIPVGGSGGSNKPPVNTASSASPEDEPVISPKEKKPRRKRPSPRPKKEVPKVEPVTERVAAGPTYSQIDEDLLRGKKSKMGFTILPAGSPQELVDQYKQRATALGLSPSKIRRAPKNGIPQKINGIPVNNPTRSNDPVSELLKKILGAINGGNKQKDKTQKVKIENSDVRNREPHASPDYLFGKSGHSGFPIDPRREHFADPTGLFEGDHSVRPETTSVDNPHQKGGIPLARFRDKLGYIDSTKRPRNKHQNGGVKLEKPVDGNTVVPPGKSTYSPDDVYALLPNNDFSKRDVGLGEVGQYEVDLRGTPLDNDRFVERGNQEGYEGYLNRHKRDAEQRRRTRGARTKSIDDLAFDTVSSVETESGVDTSQLGGYELGQPIHHVRGSHTHSGYVPAAAEGVGPQFEKPITIGSYDPNRIVSRGFFGSKRKDDRERIERLKKETSRINSEGNVHDYIGEEFYTGSSSPLPGSIGNGNKPPKSPKGPGRTSRFLDKFYDRDHKGNRQLSIQGYAAVGAVAVAGNFANYATDPIFGTPEKHGSFGEQGVKVGRGISGTLAGAGSGVAIGATIGPVGAAIGGVVGGLAGLYTSLKDAAKEIQNVKIDKDLKRFGQAVEDFLSNKSDFSSNIGHFTKGFRSIDEGVATEVDESKSFDKIKRFGTNLLLGGFSDSVVGSQSDDDKRNDEFKRKLTREKLEPLVPSLNATAEQVVKGLKFNDYEIGNSGIRNDKIKKSGIAPLVEKIAEGSGKSIKEVYEQFDKLAVTTAKETQIRERGIKVLNQQIIQTQQLARVGQAVSAAITSLHGLQGEADSLVAAFDNVVTATASPNHSERLENFGRGINDEGFNNSVDYVTSAVGGKAGENLNYTAKGINQATSLLPEIISNLVKGGATGDTLQSKIGDGLNGQVPDNVIDRYKSALSSIKPEDLASQASENPEKLVEDLTSKAFGPINEVLQKAARDLEQNFNKYNQDLVTGQGLINRTIESKSKGDNLRVRAAQSYANYRSNALGRPSDNDLSLQAVLSPFQNNQERLTGLNSQQAVNPTDIFNKLQDARKGVESKESEISSNKDQSKSGKLGKDLISLQGTAQRLNKAMENLTETSERNALIQEKINKIEEDRVGRLNFAERVLTASPADRLHIARSQQLTDVAVQQGHFANGSPEERRSVIDYLDSLGKTKLQGPGYNNTSASDIKENLLANTARVFGDNRIHADKRQQNVLRGGQAANDEAAVKAQELLIKDQQTLQDKFFNKLESIQSKFFTELSKNFKEGEKKDVIAQQGINSGELSKSRSQRTTISVLKSKSLTVDSARALSADENLGKLKENINKQESLRVNKGKFQQIATSQPVTGTDQNGLDEAAKDKLATQISEHLGIEKGEASTAIVKPIQDRIQLRLKGYTSSDGKTHAPEKFSQDLFKQELGGSLSSYQNQLRDNGTDIRNSLRRHAPGVSDGALNTYANDDNLRKKVGEITGSEADVHSRIQSGEKRDRELTGQLTDLNKPVVEPPAKAGEETVQGGQVSTPTVPIKPQTPKLSRDKLGHLSPQAFMSPNGQLQVIGKRGKLIGPRNLNGSVNQQYNKLKNEYLNKQSNNPDQPAVVNKPPVKKRNAGKQVYVGNNKQSNPNPAPPKPSQRTPGTLQQRRQGDSSGPVKPPATDTASVTKDIASLASAVGGFGQILGGLNATLNNFARVISSVKLPESIALKRDGKIEVVFNGTEVLASIDSKLKEIANKEVLVALNQQLPRALSNLSATA